MAVTAMNIVLYADDMEPITVIRAPFSAKQIDLMGGRFRVAVYPPVTIAASPADWDECSILTVEIWIERFVRKGVTHLLFFTHDEEAVLLLRSEPLPGQRKEFQEDYQRGFAAGFIAALGRLV